MRVFSGYGIPFAEPSAVAVGNFDGLHMGHKAVISALLDIGRKERLNTTVLSFFPHPAKLFAQNKAYQALLTRDEKIWLLEQTGIDTYFEFTFNLESAAMTPEAFVCDILRDGLNARCVVVGKDFRFGTRASGNADMLKTLCEPAGIAVLPLEPLSKQRDFHCAPNKISSSIIRSLIKENKLEKANEYMGFPYFITVSAPSFAADYFTVDTEKLLPPDGTYAVTILINGTTYKGTITLFNRRITLFADGIPDVVTVINGGTARVFFAEERMS